MPSASSFCFTFSMVSTESTLSARCCVHAGVLASAGDSISARVGSSKKASTLPLPASRKMCMYGSGSFVDGTSFSAMARMKSMSRYFWYHSTVCLAFLQR